MKQIPAFGGAVALLLLAACGVVDSGPVQTSTEDVDAGAASSVKAEISMGAGTLKVEGGAPGLMKAGFRYSERVGRPIVHYEVFGSKGQLTVESPKNSSSSGRSVNEWDLQMGAGIPLEMTLALGAGESNIDVSRMDLRALQVNVGAGEMSLNMAGSYSKDVTVGVNGGVGSARIRLPRDTGAEVEVQGGIGSVNAGAGLSKRDGKYYNDAWAEGKPAVHMQVHGGVGDVTLSVGETHQSN